MPIQPTFPGVYVEELPSGSRTLTGVATSVTAFVGRTLRGRVDAPIRCFGTADFDRYCGGLWADSELGYAIQQFFLNGGGEALVSRVVPAGATTSATSIAGTVAGTLALSATNPGQWGQNIRISVSHGTPGEVDEAAAPDTFHLTVREVDPALVASDPSGAILLEENYPNVSVAPNAARSVDRVLEQQSALVRVTAMPTGRPIEVDDQLLTVAAPSDGADGSDLEYEAAITRLEQADVVNLVCVPPPNRTTDTSAGVLAAALSFSESARAVLLVDPPQSWANYEHAAALAGGYAAYRSANAAVFYPRMRSIDPLQEGRARAFAPCGAIAGVMARTDEQRGVWKAPAGMDARLVGALGLVDTLDDDQNGQLNPRGINALREMPLVGPVVWGARTARGADAFADQWKYLPVRRTALFIEGSLQRGLQWAVFEPNDEPLWAQLRQSVGGFMQQLFRQGAFQGASPREAYFVNCDRETTTQADINRGIVNVVVGFAPLKPAEFVVLSFQQIAGQ